MSKTSRQGRRKHFLTSGKLNPTVILVILIVISISIIIRVLILFSLLVLILSIILVVGLPHRHPQEAWTMPFAFCTREKHPWTQFAESAETGCHCH